MNDMEFRPSRRGFLKGTAAAGAGAAAIIAAKGIVGPETGTDAVQAQIAPPETVITKSVCHQCPARCGIDVYTTDGKVHAIYGTLDNPISNGKLCPKGHFGTYILYDPDRITGPMKRTNPLKGRDQDPGFVPISWDEALETIAGRLNDLRAKGEAHRFALLLGRGWGSVDAGLQGDFGKLYGTPNAGLGHSSNCSDGSKRAKWLMDGNYSYNAYDYAHTNYLLNFGASFLEAFRPLNGNMQTWGHIRTKSPKTKVTVVDIRLTTTGAAADNLLMIKPGTDGALALAIAHVILTEGLWDRGFCGDFVSHRNEFVAGRRLSPLAFEERWTLGLIDWWNAVVKDTTPEWAEEITTIKATRIREIAEDFGRTRPAMAIFERGPTTHTNATYNAMAIHALNALVGSMYATGGLMNQMKPAYGKLPWKSDDFMDEVANAAKEAHLPRIDHAHSKDGPYWSNQIQGIPDYHMAGDPYKLDTLWFQLTSPIFSTPDSTRWEEALKDIFVITADPFPSETVWFADIVIPESTYLERMEDAPTYPNKGWPQTGLRVPAIPPIHDTRNFGDMLIEVGKRIEGPMGEYYKHLDNVENILRHLAKGFAENPGDNGVNSFETWVEKGVWFKKPYLWRQIDGEFYAWDGVDYRIPMTPEEVKATLLMSPSGKFELKSAKLEDIADFVVEKLGVKRELVGFPHWLEPQYSGTGDLFLVTPKTAMSAEGRSQNLPQAVAHYQPVGGSPSEPIAQIHPTAAAARGISNLDMVRISTPLGSIQIKARITPTARPDTVVLPYGYGHWAMGRWAAGRGQNATAIIPNISDPISGLTSNYSVRVTVERA